MLIDRTNKTDTFENIEPGTVFLYYDNFYIKGRMSNTEHYAVNLKTGQLCTIINDYPIEKLKISLVVENLKEGE